MSRNPSMVAEGEKEVAPMVEPMDGGAKLVTLVLLPSLRRTMTMTATPAMMNRQYYFAIILHNLYFSFVIYHSLYIK
jgi:hypothetical protein